TAYYSDSANYSHSTSAALSRTVNGLAGTTVIASSANPSVHGQPVSFTATVASTTSGQPTPTGGTVTFKDGTTVLGTAPLSAGKASFTTATLSTAAHSITAAFGGSCLYNPSSSAALNQTVNQAATKTAITSSANPSTHAQPV